ncbi:MAG: hypothetical protein A2Y38_14365 [Spirochaetes bacterium GWB1_59_5]|nr:MAG: hypothetical protein A2Y38_14365 [Spirochaetes bacterium GWB1_59_5]
MKRVLSLFCLPLIVSVAPVFSQGLRTNFASVVSLASESPEGVTVALHYNEAIAVNFPSDPTFIQGVEFELRVPKAFQGAESSISWSIFTKLTPQPSADRFDYAAELVATQPLPARVSVNLIIPISDKHGIKNNPFASLVPSVAGADRFPLVFKLTPIGKGLLPSMETAEFKLTIRPVLRDEGGLTVAVSVPEGADRPSASVFVDDKRAEDPHAIIMAKKGPRVIRVSAEGYREEIITVAVEAGRVIPLNITLTPNAPLLVFQAPAGTFVSLDGQTVPQAELDGLAVEPGEHTLFFRIGDYSMTRKFMALRGKVYQVVLSVELNILASP